MPGDMVPFRMIGNLYFVGTKGASCHAIDTGDGIILIDVGYDYTAEVVIESLATVGLDVSNVKYILLSHGHGDHSDGVPKIKELSGARCLMHEADICYIKGFTPDGYLHDGDVIRLGNTEILCLHTPGHTAGVMSFFFDVCEGGVTYRAGMFGGAGVNQLKKVVLDRRMFPFSWRRDYLATLDRLRGVRVEVLVGNHTWNNKTPEKYEMMLAGAEKNPFIGERAWGAFLNSCERSLLKIFKKESRESFVNYAHRGASEYYPENTALAFDKGLEMGANGIETDVRLTRDGVLVLFHDSTLERMAGKSGGVEDYTLEQLRSFDISFGGYSDKILTLEEFLERYSEREITFAIELKGEGVEVGVAELIRKYALEKKCFVTSFSLDKIKRIKEYAPEIRVGYLAKEVTDELLSELRKIGADELCPKACEITAQRVEEWHRAGFNVRAWGTSNMELGAAVYDSFANGATVNFPDKMAEYIISRAEEPIE